MSLLALLGLALVLGIRHAADPDHVVAVAAITARTRSFLAATRIAVMWGLGHSLTLFAAGAAIVAFNLSVPPRVGLSLELAVALALVIVGVWNLGSGRQADGYLAVFAAGTLAGMVLVTASMAAPLGLAVRRWQWFGSGVRRATGVLSLGMGAWLVYQIGWVDGLFLSVPRWTPH